MPEITQKERTGGAFAAKTPALDEMEFVSRGQSANPVQGMARKRSLTFHQKRVRFFTILFGAFGVLGVVIVMVLINCLPAFGR